MTDQPIKGEKLQKVLANAGFGSRREIEGWIEKGRISVNGKTANLGIRVSEEDSILIDGKDYNPPKHSQKTRVIVYHKPVGEICSRNDPEGRKTIFDKLPSIQRGRWITVGRLDINTSGLLILTTNGELANRLMHPSSEVEREYAVRVLGEVKPETLKQLRKGVELEDGTASFDHIVDVGGEGSNHWYHVVLREGRNREVRRLWEAVGCTVSRLSRVRYGTISLARSLKQGDWRDLPMKQIQGLAKLVGLQLKPDEIYQHKSQTIKGQGRASKGNKWR
ncbi:MAG: 23S rRNA pseudouridine(2605) synthase RluB [Gammaproteobacteria bacterium]|nr:23S rRNA pseudouridine(2605) synthase RluB [Gammaproteobacteria bacterium]